MAGGKQKMNERAARRKAQTHGVYISGLEGVHSLEMGVAYHYRGHFIYAWPKGNPIEPIPYSTKNGITVMGTVQDRAPLYDPQAKGLVSEDSIAALHRACAHEKENVRQQEEAKRAETAKALEEETRQAEEIAETVKRTESSALRAPQLFSSHRHMRTPSSTTIGQPSHPTSRAASYTSLASLQTATLQPPASINLDMHIYTAQAPSMPSITAYAPNTLQHFTPHDRGQYLAYSAPGSRHVSVTNTPYTSRPVTPTNHLYLHHGIPRHSLRSLRATSSTSRLTRLSTDLGSHRSFRPLQEVTEGNTSLRAAYLHSGAISDAESDTNSWTEWIDFDTKDLDDGLRYTLSRGRSPADDDDDDDDMDGLYLPGLGHRDVLSADSKRKSAVPTTKGYSRVSGEMAGSYTASHLPGLGYTSHRSEEVYTKPLAASTSTPTSTSRPRAASLALNSAYNAAKVNLNTNTNTNTNTNATPNPSIQIYISSPPPHHQSSVSIVKPTKLPNTTTSDPNTSSSKCPIHNAPCDGVTVTEQHLTQRNREGGGFRDCYPTVRSVDGRMMVDWAALVGEERGSVVTYMGRE